jgi:hypothetical protein
MYDSCNKQLTFIIYDGIQNSVFESQVLLPLLSLIEQTPNLEATLVSFEKQRPSNQLLTSRIPAHDRLHLVLCRRLPFFGSWSLRLAVFQLQRLLKFIPCNHIITRGPLAGQVALTALNQLARRHPERLRTESTIKFPEVTIQARGLCAEEHRYTLKGQQLSWFARLKNKFIYNSLKKIEWQAYRNKRATDYPNQVTIEAVSTALKDYLVATFRADPSKITIATRDIPKATAPAQVARWRIEVRQELGIPLTAVVYCYSGSFKAWQCARQTVAAFAYEYSRNKQCFMLVLTPDKEPFIAELERYKIPPANYRVITVRPADLYRYLSAGDYGMLLRERDVINWVSRPTKMLEYQAVGLKIVHNNTIAWLANK